MTDISEISPSDYLSVPAEIDEPCHVCGRTGCTAIHRDTGAYLCHDCLTTAAAQIDRHRIASMTRYPVVVAVSLENRGWFEALDQIRRPTFGIRNRWRKPVLDTLMAATGHAVQADGILWLVLAVDQPIDPWRYDIDPACDEVPTDVAALVDDLPDDVPPVPAGMFASFITFIGSCVESHASTPIPLQSVVNDESHVTDPDPPPDVQEIDGAGIEVEVEPVPDPDPDPDPDPPPGEEIGGPPEPTPRGPEPFFSDDEIEAADTGRLYQMITELVERGYKPPGGTEVMDIEELRSVVAEGARSDLREPPRPPPVRPVIETADRPMREITEDALTLLDMANRPAPRIFHRAGAMVRVVRDETNQPIIKDVGEDALRGILDRAGDWVKSSASRRGNGSDQKETVSHVPPPQHVVRDVLGLPPEEWDLPPLRGISSTPILHLDGSIHADGYDTATGILYAPPDSLELPTVPRAPTRDDVARALEVIEELFTDFPFVDDSSRANAYGALITCVIRDTINGCVPLYLVDKPQAGSGASLLQRTIAIVATGIEPAARTFPERTEEQRKELFAAVRSGARVVVFDNLEHPLSSPELSSVLTLGSISGRVLGRSDIQNLPALTIWMANGNNPGIGKDMARRIFKTRIDPAMPMPWRRSVFKHTLPGWAQENRATILAAVYTLGRAWLQAGRPAPTCEPVGGFEQWSLTVGGILEHAGVLGFLGNAMEMYLEQDDDQFEWELFLAELFDLFGTNPFTTGNLALILDDGDDASRRLRAAMPSDLAEAYSLKRRSGSFSQVLGHAFRSITGRHFPAGWCLHRGKLSKGTRTYVLTNVNTVDEGGDPE